MFKISTLAAVGLALALTSCAPVTDLFDRWTGQTLEERCVDRRVRLAAFDAISRYRELSARELLLVDHYRLFVDIACPRLAQPPVGDEPATVFQLDPRTRTLAERCDRARARLAVHEAMGQYEELTEAEQQLILDYRLFLASCAGERP